MKKVLRNRIRKYLKEHVPGTCHQIFEYLKPRMSGRVGPTNPRAVASICCRDPAIKSENQVTVGRRLVNIYEYIMGYEDE